MERRLVHNGNPISTVGTSCGWYDPEIALYLKTKRVASGWVMGGLPTYICSAAGTLTGDVREIRKCIAEALRFVAANSGTGDALHALDPIADALTALRVAVEQRNGNATSPTFFRREYWHAVADEHRKLFIQADVLPNPYVRKLSKADKTTAANVSSLRDFAERRAEQQAAAAAAERQRIASALVEQPDGQISMRM
jgi:hypothetical protein